MSEGIVQFTGTSSEVRNRTAEETTCTAEISDRTAEKSDRTAEQSDRTAEKSGRTAGNPSCPVRESTLTVIVPNKKAGKPPQEAPKADELEGGLKKVPEVISKAEEAGEVKNAHEGEAADQEVPEVQKAEEIQPTDASEEPEKEVATSEEQSEGLKSDVLNPAASLSLDSLPDIPRKDEKHHETTRTPPLAPRPKRKRSESGDAVPLRRSRRLAKEEA